MHPDTELIAYLEGTLEPEAHARLAGHLRDCATCRSTVEDFRDLLQGLRVATSGPPPLHWGRYRAELSARLEPKAQGPRWAVRPLQALLSAGLAVLLIVVALQSATRGPLSRSARAALDEGVLGARLDLLRSYPVLERLDLLEDLDLIVQLDELEHGDES